MSSTIRRRLVSTLGTLALVLPLSPLLPASPAAAAPVAADESSYALCGRVFPDPQAFWPGPTNLPTMSPWAKGNAQCRAVDFIGFDEAIDGLTFLASDEMFADFVEVYDLSQEDGPFADVLDLEEGEGMSAGLPTEDLGRDQKPMYLVRVTDEEDTTTAIEDREHFVYTLSIHGIERAGVEGGLRAAEDLATWASCEKHGDESPANCEQENAGPDNPHPILETAPDDSITAGEALRESSVWFVLSNPDGWARGDKQEGGFFYQRYNGNGVDMNRDWPSQGYTFRPYTPWSEPETRSVGEALKSVKEKWTGGIDLHGQLIDRAFSFTLIGGAERPYDKDRRVLQFVKGAWEDAETRLQWHPVIKPNDEPPSCVEVGLDPTVRASDCDPSNRIYGVQWGTIWDTIDYTVTGALGDWIDSPLGLDADGIDNEMSMSHLSNCGVGTCFLPDFEQLHVDGNKSLVYAMIHYSLLPEDTSFDYEGEVAYLFNPERIKDPGSRRTKVKPKFAKLPQQEPLEFTIAHGGGESTTEEFEVKGPAQGVYNGGIRVTVTWSNVRGVAAGSLNEIAIDRRRSGEEDPQRGEEEGDEWQTQNSYFNQAPTYLQGGAQLDVNDPQPGSYRVRVSGIAASEFDVKVEFLPEEAWPDPGQLSYDVSNMDFFDELAPFVGDPNKLVRLPVTDVLSGRVDLAQFDSVIAADNAFLPNYVVPQKPTPAQEPVEGSVNVPAPGAGARSPATSGFLEFDVEQPQGRLEVTVTSDTVLDPDLYLQVQLEDGSWSDDLAEGETGRSFLETLTHRGVDPGHYRLEVHNWAGAPGPADVGIEFTGRPKVDNPSTFTQGDLDRMSRLAKDFVAQGGNLVLTDDSVRALEWMDVVAEGSVAEQKVYAGHVQFSADNGDTTTYEDPLAANVDQPGAAEGDGHRHQVAEPVPTGYAIQDDSGGDMNTHPQWAVERRAFEEAGGRVVGVVGDDAVTLGEIPVGDGVVRVLGSLLPTPTEEFDHPFGLASYGVTYTGYEVLRNMLD
ncbi:MAG: M14 family zinc carboxypeptidase, partial [Nitriliruptorales bacterium]